VTAAKQIVAGRVAIDMLAGPSELVILADDTAEHEMIAADLLAQAEHDPDAMPVLVTTDSNLVPAVNSALQSQLADLPTAETARAALEHGFAVVAGMLDEAIEVVDQLAPEHLQVLTRDAQQVADRLSRYGGIFIGPRSAEVLGDYGAGPNHTLPTGGTARFVGGLSVLNFLRINTWLRIDQPDASLLKDATRLARLEGLEAHARAAERRQG
jgi:histidinol dehydrogenase